MVNPKEVPIGPIKTDSTFPPYSFIFSFPLTGLKIDMKIRDGNNLIKTLSVPADLLIDAGNNKKLTIKPFDHDFKPGDYGYRLKLNPNGIRDTYIFGTISVIDG